MYIEIMVILPSFNLLPLLPEKDRISAAPGNRLSIKSISPLICCSEPNKIQGKQKVLMGPEGHASVVEAI